MITQLIGPITGLLDQFIEDKDQKAKLAHELATMSQEHANSIALAQIEVNKIEAKGNWMQRSWRPLIGLTCAVAFMWHFVLHPITLFMVAVFGVDIPNLPEFDMTSLLTVLGGLLGLGSLRTYEKAKGITK